MTKGWALAWEEIGMGSVLIVEDSHPMQRTLRRLFETDSLEVEIAGDGISALEMFKKRVPRVVVLDLKLPGLSGKEVCRAFKAYMPSVPIVIVSAYAQVEDKVLLLELGADDYVTKPFSPRELLARVRRAMRRNGAAPNVMSDIIPDEVSHQVMAFGDIHIDFTSMKATRSGKPVTLTAQEFRLLRFWARSPERVFTRIELLREVWGYQSYPSTRTVDNHILHLRQKLEPDPTNPRFFLTMHGTGYMFAPSGSFHDAEGSVPHPLLS